MAPALMLEGCFLVNANKHGFKLTNKIVSSICSARKFRQGRVLRRRGGPSIAQRRTPVAQCRRGEIPSRSGLETPFRQAKRVSIKARSASPRHAGGANVRPNARLGTSFRTLFPETQNQKTTSVLVLLRVGPLLPGRRLRRRMFVKCVVSTCRATSTTAEISQLWGDRGQT